MNIIIVGDGKVGYTLAEHLTLEKHDVTIVDNNEEALKKADETLDVMCVKGNGARASVLLEAGIETADLVIAATSRDEMNMICCFVAKKLSSAHTVARIRDPEFYDDFIMLRNEMGIDMVVNPELTAAREIGNILQFPSAMNVEHFMGGKIRMVDLKLIESDPLVNMPLSKAGKYLPPNVLVAAVQRDDDVYIPRGDFEFHAKDKIYMVGQLTGLTAFFKGIDRYAQKINSVVIVGGGKISFYLSELVHFSNMKVKLIELNEKKALQLSDLLEHATIIQGDGTDPELLDSENIEDADAFVALTDRDEENLITAMYAAEKHVKKVIAKTNRVSLPGIINKLGLDSIVSPKMITSNYILAYVRGLQNSEGSIVETLYKIVDGKAEAISFIANNTTTFINKPIRELNLKKNVLIAAIGHGKEVTVPHGNEVIQEGDRVLVVSKDTHVINDLNDILE